MATGETSLGELYARIGLNFDDLEHNFVQVDRSLRDNMARLNRQRRIIDIQTRIDLQGLDQAADATRIFEIRQRSLQQQIVNQKERLQVLATVYEDAKNRTGELSDETQRAQLEYEQARLAVRRLEVQLEQLNETQNETGDSFGSWKDKLDSLIETGRVISAIENIQQVLAAVGEESMRVINRFRELQTQAYKFNMPFNQFKDFALQIKLAGGEIDDVHGYLAGISDALIKGNNFAVHSQAV